MKTMSLSFQSILEGNPPNNTNVLCLTKDKISGKEKITSGFYSKGIFWDSSGSKAQNINHTQRTWDDDIEDFVPFVDIEVIAWAKAERE